MTVIPSHPLSPREQQVLSGLMMGLTNKEIAQEFATTEATVKVQMKSILRKLRVSTRLEAAVMCMRAALELPCPRCGYIDKGKSHGAGNGTRHD